MEKQYSILHISDLHKPENCNLDNLLYSIQKDCEIYTNEGICKPDIIVVSGDLVEGSKDDDGVDIIKEQYAEVGKFLEKLADLFLNGNRMRMIIVPGNHDYCYKLSKDSMELSPEEKLKEDYKLLKGETIQIFNYGNCRRDFTYVDDIVEGVYRVMQKAPERKKGEDGLPIPPYAVYNIGGGQPENLLDFVNILQEELVRAGVLPSDFDFEAHKELVPMQPGDVPTTYADATALERDFGFTPKITLREGLRKFAEWYKGYYG